MANMVKCEVVIIGRDGQPHSETVYASSLFAAAAKGLSGACRLWWYDPTVLYLTVRQNGREWRVRTVRIHEWGRSQGR